MTRQTTWTHAAELYYYFTGYRVDPPATAAPRPTAPVVTRPRPGPRSSGALVCPATSRRR
jgi:hypothetical protein